MTATVAHCPACAIVAELTKHRDQTAPEWDVRRGVLNFARIIAKQACPAYVPPVRTEETA